MPDAPPRVLVLRPGDDVAVAVQALRAGEIVVGDGREVRVSGDVPAGHKISLARVPEGQLVRKYGQVIGYATASIVPGEYVHTHNLAVGPLHLNYEFGTDVRPADTVLEGERRTFAGYARADGRVGTRNYLAIVSTVNCSASVSRFIAERLRGDALQAYPNVDGVIAVTHKAGCGMNIDGEDMRLLQRVLAGYARHPNVAGYILCGLGCETNQAVRLIENQGLISLAFDRQRPVVVTIQEAGGVTKAVEAGVREIQKLLPVANACRRTPQPVSEIVLATNCGGSDAYSGITANPALGWAVDELVRQGGTAAIAETPETYGAEHLLTRRAVSREVGEKLIQLMRWWERYTAIHGAVIDNNPAPGNKAGGLTTIYEKSLGAVAKGGSTPLQEVYQYGERMEKKGFVFMDTPGHDPVSITGLVAGGGNVIAFTTGRGSVFGCKPTPSIKIATNVMLYEHMGDDMDINAGVILQGASVADVGRTIFEKVIAVASGERTRSELHGIGDEEFNPWMIGPCL
ncbi:MAG: altronate dehydratase [Armatimonadetes bacterium]|nr:altronate dehydratase [Armatimonadota bacterium]